MESPLRQAAPDTSPKGGGRGVNTPYTLSGSYVATVSLRLGHAMALTTHCVVIHYHGAASLPIGRG